MTRLRRRATAAVLAAALWATPTLAHADDEYTVRPGDSLIGIAAGSGVSLSSLLRANQLSLASVIHPGQRLVIPGASAPSSPTPSATASTYTVRWGDTLSGIAARHRIPLSSLLAANEMTARSLIMPGTRLTLPAGAATPSTAPAPSTPPAAATAPTAAATHTVRRGDTLSGIAMTYGVSLPALLRANGMTAASLITPGMTLRLPAGATAPASSSSGSSGSSGSAGSAGPSTSSASAGSATGQTGVAKVVAFALAQQGKPYRFFAKGPDAFDCSGLTLAAYAQIGVKLVHYSGSQARQGTAVDFHNEPIMPGDLVFLQTRGSERINHVGMAIDSTTWIHAVGRGTTVRTGRIPADSAITAVRRYVGS